MPLLDLPKKQKEEGWVFTHAEKKAREVLPDEQIKAANHDPNLIMGLILNEQRDPELTLVRNDVMGSLDKQNINPIRLLKATAHLTIPQRKKVMQSIISSFFRKKKDTLDPDSFITNMILKLGEPEELLEMDMFDFIIRYEALFKGKSKY